MKFALVVLAFVAAASAQYNQGQYFNNKQYNQNPYSRYTTPAPYRATYTPSVYPTYKPAVYSTPAPIAIRVNQDARNANIVKYGSESNPDGSYSYFYETDNGIAAQEQGVPRNLGGNPPASAVVNQGSYAYTSPEGLPVSISYVADENGFQPQGSVIPTSPPVPEQILRALAYIASKNYPSQK